jgi:hypothetical protein
LHGDGQGFCIDPAEAENPHPDAWCSKCEEIRLAHAGEWNNESHAVTDISLVCGDCYEEIKRRNMVATMGNKPVR